MSSQFCHIFLNETDASQELKKSISLLHHHFMADIKLNMAWSSYDAIVIN